MQYLADEATKWVPPFDPFFFGLIAMSLFIVMGLVTWSYRDVSNRHEHKSNDSKGHH